MRKTTKKASKKTTAKKATTKQTKASKPKTKKLAGDRPSGRCPMGYSSPDHCSWLVGNECRSPWFPVGNAKIQKKRPKKLKDIDWMTCYFK